MSALRCHRPATWRGLAAGALLLLLPALTRPSAASGSPAADTTRGSGHSPGGALLRSAVLPGWGQVYNGQPLKTPIIVGAIGGLVYAVVHLNGEYRLYREAYQYKAWQDLVDSGQATDNPKSGYSDSYDEVTASIGAVPKGYLLAQRNALRRNRDLSILGIGIVWSLQVLDAYVSAHLLDFDVGEDLTLRVAPGLDPGGRMTLSPTVVWRPGRR